MEEELEVVSVRITKPLSRMIKNYMELDAHVTISDFVRDAIREKIKKDTPWLYNEMLNKPKEPKKSTTLFRKGLAGES